MIEYNTGNFGWKPELINPVTDKPRIALVFCWSSNRLDDWADLVRPSDGLLFRDFGAHRGSAEVEEDFEYLLNSVAAVNLKVPIILTTHRVELMSNDVSRPDCIFVLEYGAKAAKPIWTLTSKEIRFAHNLQKMWMGGMFDK